MPNSILILSGVLFLSSQNPAYLPSPKANLWISDQDKVQAQTMNSGVMLSTTKEKGVAFAHGLNAKELQRIQIVSPQNYSALESCPNTPTIQEGAGLYIHPRQILNPNKRKKLNECGFDDLHFISEEFNQSAPLKAEFRAKELALKANGLRIRKASWQDGKRHLLIDETPLHHGEIQKLLAPLSAFYTIKQQRTPKPGNTLIIEVTLFEFFRSAADSLGINWPEQLKIFSLANAFDLKALNSEASLSFNFNQMQGLSKVLAKPRLRVQAGEKASFQSGGEIPITVITENVQKTSWKPYGLILDLSLAPHTKAGDQEINLSFEVELSEPQLSQGQESIPSIQTRKLKSKFDLRINETTLLSSMTQQRSGSNKNGVYGLMNVPLAGKLFSKQSSQDQASELWFAVRPTWEDMPFTRQMKAKEDEFRKF